MSPRSSPGEERRPDSRERRKSSLSVHQARILITLCISPEIPAGFGPGSRSPKSTENALIRTSVEMTCNPTGEPKPVVRWMFGPMYLHSTGRFQILSNGNLRIRNVTKADTGEYTCEASNRLGKATRKGFLNVVGMIFRLFSSLLLLKEASTVGTNCRYIVGNV